MFDLAEIIRQHEGKTLEFKRDLSSPDKVMRTLVAFALEMVRRGEVARRC